MFGVVIIANLAKKVRNSVFYFKVNKMFVLVILYYQENLLYRKALT